jgi:transcriptional regulator with XRE-family HTH domain
MRLVPQQIAAAMALAGLNQHEFAALAGIGRTTLNKTLNEATTPDEETLHRIRVTLEQQGIEFLDHEGVRRRPEGVEVMNGQEGLSKFLDGVYQHLKEFGGKVMVTGVLDEQWTKYGGEHIKNIHVPRMVQLCNERNDIEVLSLCPEGTHEFDYDSYTKYRSQPRELFDSVPFYVYGDSLAIIVFQADPAPKIILIHSSVVAHAYKNQFTQLWGLAKEISKPSDNAPPPKGVLS